LPLVYDELRELAAQRLRRERGDHTLQATALVHEAYMRLVGPAQGDATAQTEGGAVWRNRAHFMALAARAMRRVLVDHARRRSAAKRGGAGAERARGAGVSADEVADPQSSPDEVLALEELLVRLADLDERKARVVELRVFAGMTGEEIAEALGVARSTVADDWAVARAWLAAQMQGGGS
jgi:RNA polymerase sigma factor (TIGR02999 family)